MADAPQGVADGVNDAPMLLEKAEPAIMEALAMAILAFLSLPFYTAVSRFSPISCIAAVA